MSKNILRYLAVALIAVALGFAIYYFSQPAATASAGPGANGLAHLSTNLGDGHAPDAGGLTLVSGLLDTLKNLLLIAIVTVTVGFLQKILSRRPEPARAR
jgi:hypothetical protein